MNRLFNKRCPTELIQFHCFVLLDEVKEKIRMLRAYGVDESDILDAMNEEELFPQLVVTKDYKIFLITDERRSEVKMEPLVKAVYLLFLSHPEGIVLKCLPDYREELMRIYLLLRPVGLTERVRKSITDVTDPTHNSINEKCARIRNIFSDCLSSNVVKYYAISGKRGGTKMIELVRDNVIWQCKMPFPQALRT
jgi:hypothetical protein